MVPVHSAGFWITHCPRCSKCWCQQIFYVVASMFLTVSHRIQIISPWIRICQAHSRQTRFSTIFGDLLPQFCFNVTKFPSNFNGNIKLVWLKICPWILNSFICLKHAHPLDTCWQSFCRSYRAQTILLFILIILPYTVYYFYIINTRTLIMKMKEIVLCGMYFKKTIVWLWNSWLPN